MKNEQWPTLSSLCFLISVHFVFHNSQDINIALLSLVFQVVFLNDFSFQNPQYILQC